MSEDKEVKCPVCGDYIELEDDLSVGETICCSGCYVDLKIVKLRPPILEEIVSSFEEDDDEDDDF